MIKQIIPAGCNRECLVLTEDGKVFLLRYRSDGEFDWVKMPELNDGGEALDVADEISHLRSLLRMVSANLHNPILGGISED